MKQKAKWTQYLLAALIVLIGAAASLLILTKPWKTEHYKVSFYDLDGQLLTQYKAENGKSLLPPPFEKDGYMFKNWDKDLYAVTEDLEVYPICEKIGDAKNIVYADTVYADTGSEFSVTPKLSGTVDCSGFTIEMGYDAELLHFEGADAVLDGLTVEENNGTVTMMWSDHAPVTEETDLAVLYFKCKGNGSYSTNLPFLTKEIVTLERGEEVYTDSTAYDATLYLYQK